MKKITIIMLLLMSTNVMAAWTKLESEHTPAVTVYVDIGKIRHVGVNNVRMQHLMNFKNEVKNSSGRAYLSSKELVEYNCNEEHYRVIASSLYVRRMGQGKVVSFSSDVKQWQPVEFNTLEESLWKAACGKPSISQHD
ncbi:MAG: hypothetical protein PHO76_01790 [Methylotenera sp.]|nr:hypothetical protein [Methylotenera sp.]MDD4925382.1 hypothetical protein [Methylotenera sp.]